jgi:hypothetical protein
LKIALEHEIFYDPTPLAYYRDTGNSLRSEISIIQHYDSMKYLYSQIREKLSVCNGANNSIKMIKRSIYEIDFSKLILYLSIRNYAKVKTTLMDLLTSDPLRAPILISRIVIVHLISKRKHNF